MAEKPRILIVDDEAVEHGSPQETKSKKADDFLIPPLHFCPYMPLKFPQFCP
ncbi:MAG: hypothetical protein FD156_660 [Nitrospirae bacterium]|nr:MAG: hypothetical protein FD156_660 [Nitrospirota bacterium]